MHMHLSTLNTKVNEFKQMPASQKLKSQLSYMNEYNFIYGTKFMEQKHDQLTEHSYMHVFHSSAHVSANYVAQQ